MAYNKKKTEGNISSLKNAKVLKIMKNKESTYQVGFFSSFEDDFIIDVIKYKTKSGAYTEKNTIANKDMPKWIEIYKNEGFN